MLYKKAWLEALNMGVSNNKYLQRLVERQIRSNARKGLFEAANIEVTYDPQTETLTSYNKPKNTIAHIRSTLNVLKR